MNYHRYNLAIRETIKWHIMCYCFYFGRKIAEMIVDIKIYFNFVLCENVTKLILNKKLFLLSIKITLFIYNVILPEKRTEIVTVSSLLCCIYFYPCLKSLFNLKLVMIIIAWHNSTQCNTL